jgi:hypothetical protein
VGVGLLPRARARASSIGSRRGSGRGRNSRWVQPDDKRMLASSQPQRATICDSSLVRADAQIATWHRLRRARLQPRA